MSTVGEVSIIRERLHRYYKTAKRSLQKYESQNILSMTQEKKEFVWKQIGRLEGILKAVEVVEGRANENDFEFMGDFYK